MDRLSLLLPGGSEATIFDMILQSQFSDTITPAFNYVFHHVLLPNFPILAPLIGLKHELLAILMLQTQSRYLTSSSATLQEYMFGWCRKEAVSQGTASTTADTASDKPSTTTASQGAVGLSTRSTLISLAAEVGWPYLRGLLMDIHAEGAEFEANAAAVETPTPSGSNADTDSDASTNTSASSSSSETTSALRSRLAAISAFVARYIPYGVAAVETARLVQLVRFSAGLSKYPSIGHALARLILVKASSMPGAQSAPISRPVRVFEAVMSGLRLAVIISLVILKAMEWYAASRENSEIRTKAKMPPKCQPPPPPLHPQVKTLIESTRRPNACPLCRGSIKGPVVLPSGVVYCVACIFAHFESPTGGLFCPCTGQACIVDDVRRIFE